MACTKGHSAARRSSASATSPGWRSGTPAAVPARGTQVCSCFDVTEPQIDAVLSHCTGAPETQLAQLQQRLRCGTNCGSCLPRLRTMVRRQLAAA